MKIAIIGSTQYYGKMEEYAKKLRERGFEVRLPFFDFHNLTEFEICEKNRENIEWADEVHIFWDRRSLGTIFDFGMAFALRKPIKIVYLEEKTFENLMRQYEERSLKEGCQANCVWFGVGARCEHPRQFGKYCWSVRSCQLYKEG